MFVIKERIKKFFKSYKSIIYISLFINIVLLIVLYFVISNNRIYSFSGKNDFIAINDGLIVLNNDINILNGSSIMYTNNNDYDIKEYKIGYYVMNEKELVKIVTVEQKLDTPIKLSDIINNFTPLNVVEKNTSDIYFTHTKKRMLNDGLYFIIEAKTDTNEDIFEKLKLNITKISKY